MFLFINQRKKATLTWLIEFYDAPGKIPAIANRSRLVAPGETKAWTASSRLLNQLPEISTEWINSLGLNAVTGDSLIMLMSISRSSLPVNNEVAEPASLTERYSAPRTAVGLNAMIPDIGAGGFHWIAPENFGALWAGLVMVGKRMVPCWVSLRSTQPTIYCANGRFSSMVS